MFKNSRGEFAGITKAASVDLFSEDKEYAVLVAAGATNCVDNITNSLIEEIPEEGIRICVIGRLDKPYVLTSAEELALFAKKHFDEKITIVFIGDGTVKEKIITIFSNLDNVKLIMTGKLSPIPKSVFEKITYFIGSSGCAWVPYNNKKITISVDAYDLMAIGVMGYSTTHIIERQEEPKESVSDLLEKIIYTDYLSRFEYVEAQIKPLSDAYNKHFLFLNNSAKKKEYYDISKMKLTRKEKIYRIVFSIFGVKKTKKIHDMICNKISLNKQKRQNEQ